MYKVPKVLKVKALEEYKLLLEFENGEDVAPENLYYDSTLLEE